MRDWILQHRVIAILRDFPLEKTLACAQALYDGGIRMLEIALNSPQALRQISMLREHFGETLLLGAGTAITLERVMDASAAGARYLLTPSVREEVLAYCRKEQLELLPGVLSPSDVDLCLHYGYSTLKLFPAGELPPTYIKSLKGPFDNTEYVAVGGVNAGNAKQFLERGFLGVGIGSGLVSKRAVELSDWQAVTREANELLCSIN